MELFNRIEPINDLNVFSVLVQDREHQNCG